jgi:hypothetical protein
MHKQRISTSQPKPGKRSGFPKTDLRYWRETIRNPVSIRKIQRIVAGAALVLVGALAAGTWFRADSAEVDDQRTRLGLSDEETLVRTELLPNVPGRASRYLPLEGSGM